MAFKFLNGTNWSTAGDWTPVNAPITGDDVSVSDSARDITTGDQGGVDLASMLVPSRYVGAFGAAGAPLKIAATKVVYKGRGGFYYESDKGGTTLRTDEMIMDPADIGVKWEIGSNAADSGFVDKILAARGVGLIKGAGIFDTVTTPRVQVMKECDLTIAAGITNPLTDLENQGGRVKCDSVITKLQMFGGEHTQDTAKVVYANIIGGSFIYNHLAVSGDGTTLVIWDGATLVLDAISRLKTITNVYLLPGSRMIPNRADGINVIITNFFDYRR